MFHEGWWACLRQCRCHQSDLIHCVSIVKVASEFVVKVCDVRADTALQFIPCTGQMLDFAGETRWTSPCTAPSKLSHQRVWVGHRIPWGLPMLLPRWAQSVHRSSHRGEEHRGISGSVGCANEEEDSAYLADVGKWGKLPETLMTEPFLRVGLLWLSQPARSRWLWPSVIVGSWASTVAFRCELHDQVVHGGRWCIWHHPKWRCKTKQTWGWGRSEEEQQNPKTNTPKPPKCMRWQSGNAIEVR